MCSMKSSGVRALNCSHSATTTQLAHRTGQDRVCAFEHESGQRDFLDGWIKRADCASASRSASAIFNKGASRTRQYSAQTRGQQTPPFFCVAFQALQARAQRREALWIITQHLRRPADNLGLTLSPRDHEGRDLLTGQIIVPADVITGPGPVKKLCSIIP